MKDPFNKKKSSNKFEAGMQRGNFGDMMKMREKQLPEIEDSIRDALKDYSGQNICIIVVNEDENGMPSGSQVVMAGVGRMEAQVAMAKALSKCSDKALELLMDTANGDVKAMLAVAAALVDSMDKEK